MDPGIFQGLVAIGLCGTTAFGAIAVYQFKGIKQDLSQHITESHEFREEFIEWRTNTRNHIENTRIHNGSK